MQKRHIKLQSSEVVTLEEGRHHHPQFQFRDRSHCLLLSCQGQDISSLMSIFNVSRITIYNWFNRWEKHGLLGLYNQKEQGRKALLTDSDIEKVQQRVRENPQQLKAVRVQLKEDLSKEFSDKTLKRFLKVWWQMASFPKILKICTRPRKLSV